MAEQLCLSFNVHDAKAYMQTMFHLEGQRDELNDAINAARTDARERGVPTKAVEAAIKAAKGRRKSALSPAEFQVLMDAADALLPAKEADDDPAARNRAVWDAAKGLHPEALGESVEAFTFATAAGQATARRRHTQHEEEA